MSAVLDTPLNGLGMIPLGKAIEGLTMSKSFRHGLNTVVSACRGKHLLDKRLYIYWPHVFKSLNAHREIKSMLLNFIKITDTFLRKRVSSKKLKSVFNFCSLNACLLTDIN